jgi:hypothetical protein
MIFFIERKYYWFRVQLYSLIMVALVCAIQYRRFAPLETLGWWLAFLVGFVIIQNAAKK